MIVSPTQSEIKLRFQRNNVASLIPLQNGVIFPSYSLKGLVFIEDREPLVVCLSSVFVCASAAFSEEEVNVWMTGLTWLMADTQRAPAPQQTDRCVQGSRLARGTCRSLTLPPCGRGAELLLAEASAAGCGSRRNECTQALIKLAVCVCVCVSAGCQDEKRWRLMSDKMS